MGTFAGAFSLAMTKGQGVRYPDPSVAIISIPGSAATNGGEMTLAAKSVAGGSTRIDISGHTMGLFGSTLRSNVEGLSSYLKAVPWTNIKHAEDRAPDRGNLVEEIERLADLHRKGHLTGTEFEAAKRKILV